MEYVEICLESWKVLAGLLGLLSVSFYPSSLTGNPDTTSGLLSFKNASFLVLKFWATTSLLGHPQHFPQDSG